MGGNPEGFFGAPYSVPGFHRPISELAWSYGAVMSIEFRPFWLV